MVLTKSDCDIKCIIFKVKNQRVRPPRPLLPPSLRLTPGSPVWEIPRVSCLLISAGETGTRAREGWGRGAPLQAGAGRRGAAGLGGSAARPAPPARPPWSRRAGRARGATYTPGLAARTSKVELAARAPDARGPRSPHRGRRLYRPCSARIASPGRARGWRRAPREGRSAGRAAALGGAPGIRRALPRHLVQNDCAPAGPAPRHADGSESVGVGAQNFPGSAKPPPRSRRCSLGGERRGRGARGGQRWGWGLGLARPRPRPILLSLRIKAGLPSSDSGALPPLFGGLLTTA